jgi:hypothetical protein
MLNISTTRRHIMEVTPTISRSKRCMVPQAKVQVPNLFIYLNQTPVFERYALLESSRVNVSNNVSNNVLAMSHSRHSYSECLNNVLK